jgi:hypothetical protein
MPRQQTDKFLTRVTGRTNNPDPELGRIHDWEALKDLVKKTTKKNPLHHTRLPAGTKKGRAFCSPLF